MECYYCREGEGSFHTVFTELTEHFIETAGCDAQSPVFWHSALFRTHGDYGKRRWRMLPSSAEGWRDAPFVNPNGGDFSLPCVVSSVMCRTCAGHRRLAFECGKLIRLVSVLATPWLKQFVFIVMKAACVLTQSIVFLQLKWHSPLYFTGISTPLAPDSPDWRWESSSDLNW